MADLEKLALKRDRGYLVRLGVMLIVAVIIAAAEYNGLTGGKFGDCVANAYLGRDPGAPAPPAAGVNQASQAAETTEKPSK